MAQAILGDSFPPEKRGLAFALYGITGHLRSSHWSERWEVGSHRQLLLAAWIFYINVPVGALALALVYQACREIPPYLAAHEEAALRVRLHRGFRS